MGWVDMPLEEESFPILCRIGMFNPDPAASSHLRRKSLIPDDDSYACDDTA